MWRLDADEDIGSDEGGATDAGVARCAARHAEADRRGADE
jgi:hypothetical protein